MNGSPLPNNAMIYWAQSPAPESVEKVLENWRTVCPGWDVKIYSQETALAFIDSNFGSDAGSLFAKCRFPAMQSDVFRVLWALKVGGVYVDITFQPKAPPAFHSPRTSLTVVKWHHGRIVNGVFSAVAESAPLSRIAGHILSNLRSQKQGNIWEITGPGAWIESLQGMGADDFSTIEKPVLFERYLDFSGYESSTRGTKEHWSERQKTEHLYSN